MKNETPDVLLPTAFDASIGIFTDRENEEKNLRKSVVEWINNKLLPELEKYKPRVDVKTRKVTGYFAVQCPNEYYGDKNNTRDEWKTIYESIITPLGYQPVYTWEGGGMYDMVGVKWETKL